MTLKIAKFFVRTVLIIGIGLLGYKYFLAWQEDQMDTAPITSLHTHEGIGIALPKPAPGWDI